MFYNVLSGIKIKFMYQEGLTLRTYKEAREVIEKDQEAIVLFTHGEHFDYDDAGNGVTGKWVLDRESVETVEKVIIYFRENDETINRIFIGNYVGIRKSDLPERYMIRFSSLKEVGTTETNWPDFANSGQNPVGYVIG